MPTGRSQRPCANLAPRSPLDERHAMGGKVVDNDSGHEQGHLMFARRPPNAT